MRKFILIGIMALICGSAMAMELPLGQLKQGVAFSTIDNKFNYLSTLEVISYKGFALEVGYAGKAKSTGDKVAAVISYDLINAKRLGVTLPILDLIEFRPGVYFAYGRLTGSNETDMGVSATFLNYKF
jgi:hypothetical protein